MYHHLEGQLALLAPSRAVISAGGVGYELRIPLSTYRALHGREGQQVRLLAHLQVLDDDLRLYGFLTQAERDLFRLATSISGVGPAIALALLATLEPAAFARAVTAGDSRSLQKVKGVGAKLSERIVLELKDRALELSTLLDGKASPAPSASAVPESVAADAVQALVITGFSRREANQRVEAAIAALAARSSGGQGTAPVPPTVDEILKAAFRGGG